MVENVFSSKMNCLIYPMVVLKSIFIFCVNQSIGLFFDEFSHLFC